MEKSNLTLGSLFDGIGGFPYAASFFGKLGNSIAVLRVAYIMQGIRDVLLREEV